MKKYLYETMADCITQKINEDVWPVGMKLPGEKELTSKSVTLNNPLEQLNSVGDMIKAAGCEPESVHYSIRHCLPDQSIRDEFTYGEGEKITDYEVNDSFKAENLYPVKADGLEIVGQDESHFRGIVKEVEFQGFQNKIILEMQDNNHLQVFACADEEVRQGEMYGVRIKKRKNVEI